MPSLCYAVIEIFRTEKRSLTFIKPDIMSNSHFLRVKLTLPTFTFSFSPIIIWLKRFEEKCYL